tara:strand:- start:958 stop:1272 length:315 start_codon:yes stop_codon:yes gene_type:complete
MVKIKKERFIYKGDMELVDKEKVTTIPTVKGIGKVLVGKDVKGIFVKDVGEASSDIEQKFPGGYAEVWQGKFISLDSSKKFKVAGTYEEGETYTILFYNVKQVR